MHFKEYTYNESDFNQFDIFVMDLVEITKNFEEENRSEIISLESKIKFLERKRI